jgi:hypothetical protein
MSQNPGATCTISKATGGDHPSAVLYIDGMNQ